MRLGRAIGYGFLVWLIPFVISFLVFPYKAKVVDHANYAGDNITLARADVLRLELFESIMPIVLAAVVGFFAVNYLRRARPGGSLLRQGALLGWIWLIISIAVDLPLMLSPPIRMPLSLYFADIGLTYLMIPLITTSIALAADPTRAPRPISPADAVI